MFLRSSLGAPGAPASIGAARELVDAPAAVRGWLYDSLEHWWALLVGAPPRSA